MEILQDTFQIEEAVYQIFSMEATGLTNKKRAVCKIDDGVNVLPEELMEDILSRIDAEEVCALKLTSKGFLSLISSKSFMAKHVNQMKNLNRSVFLFQEEFVYSPLFYSKDGVDNIINGRLVTEEDRAIEILSAAGSLCLYCNVFDDFYLINPTTNEKRRMPTCKIVYPTGCTWAQVIFGMGYVSEDDDYKVVRVALFNSHDFMSEVTVYSRNSGCWVRAKDFPCDFPILQPGVLVCGRLHWRSTIFFNKYSITSYNLKDGTYSRFEIPEVPLLLGAQQIVSLDDETLAISCSTLKDSSAHTIWILKNYDDKKSWMKVDIKLTGPNVDNGLITLQPLCLVNPKREELLIRIDPVGRFIMYNMHTKVYRDFRSEVIAEGYMTPYTFISSIHSPYPVAK